MAMRNAVTTAIERWVANGMVDPELASVLQGEVDAHTARVRRLTAQYAIGATAGLILLIAGGVFLSRAWASLGIPTRCGILAAIGLSLMVLGRVTAARARVEPVGYRSPEAGG